MIDSREHFLVTKRPKGLAKGVMETLDLLADQGGKSGFGHVGRKSSLSAHDVFGWNWHLCFLQVC